MSKRAREQRRRVRAWHRYYENVIATERGKRRGYEELAQVHGAYVSILLNRLGATEDNMVTITPPEVTEALQKYEARAVPAENNFGLYYKVKEE